MFPFSDCVSKTCNQIGRVRSSAFTLTFEPPDLDVIFCMRMAHDHSSPRIENQDHSLVRGQI